MTGVFRVDLEAFIINLEAVVTMPLLRIAVKVVYVLMSDMAFMDPWIRIRRMSW